MIARLILALGLLLAASAARAETLVVELSTDLVSVTSEFGGADIALFGVIERDAQTVSRSGKYGVLVIADGPPQDVLVSRKERRFGIWLNAHSARFDDVPSYRAELTTEATPEERARWLELAHAAQGQSTDLKPGQEAFREAMIAAKTEDKVAVEGNGAVEMLTDRFFKTAIPIPGVAQNGDYTVWVHLFADGVLLDSHESHFSIAKVGFEEQLFDVSRTNPLLYGIGVVALALITGYVGGIVFRRG